MSAAIASVTVAAIGVGLSAYGASQQASAQSKAGKQAAISSGQQQAQNEFEAKRIIEQTQEEARKARAQAIYARGTQVATAASAGVLVGDGSVQSMSDEVTRLSEQDAVAILFSGANGYINKNESGRLAAENGRFQSQQANAASRSTLLAGFGSALQDAGSVAGSVYKQWGNGPTTGEK